MSLYESLKEMAYTLRGEKQRELYEQLIDLGAQALELHHEVHRLTLENEELKKKPDRKPNRTTQRALSYPPIRQ